MLAKRAIFFLVIIITFLSLSHVSSAQTCTIEYGRSGFNTMDCYMRNPDCSYTALRDSDEICRRCSDVGGSRDERDPLYTYCNDPCTGKSCDDSNLCTLDTCADGKCSNLPASGGPCDDSDPCTTADMCDGGSCVGKMMLCPEYEVCTDGFCQKRTCGELSGKVCGPGWSCDGEAAVASDADECCLGECIEDPKEEVAPADTPAEIDCPEGYSPTRDFCPLGTESGSYSCSTTYRFWFIEKEAQSTYCSGGMICRKSCPTVLFAADCPSDKGMCNADSRPGVEAAPTEPAPDAPRVTPTPPPTLMPTPGPSGDGESTVELESEVEEESPIVESNEPLTVKVKIVVFNPMVPVELQDRCVHKLDTPQPIIACMGWHDPKDLIEEYIGIIKKASGGYVNYVILDNIPRERFPPITGNTSDGLTMEEYLSCKSSDEKNMSRDCLTQADFIKIFDEERICELADSHALSEVWIFGGPYMGKFFEANMAGPEGWDTNGPVISGTKCTVPVHIMGFNPEREVAYMLESFSHRIEGTMDRFLDEESQGFDGQEERYSQSISTNPSCLDGSLEVEPLSALEHCGNVHFTPNSLCHYQYDSNISVVSDCEDWYTYPDLRGSKELITCSEWGCSKEGYLTWWLTHLPRSPGITDGKYNNWWKYIVFDRA